MARQSLVWKGKALTEKMRAAQKLGVNATMSDSVLHAKANHLWQNRSTRLENAIGIRTIAAEVPGGVEGVWGTQGARYALIHELGGVIVPVKAKALKFRLLDGSFRIVKSVTIPARPYLRPAADATYPQLAGNIKKAFQKLGGSDAGTS